MPPAWPCRAGSARQLNGDDLTATSTASNGLEVKSWERQARDITRDISSSDKYKSLALHAEVKLAESLERCERVCASTFTPAGEAKPNKLKTAVCCQVSAPGRSSHSCTAWKHCVHSMPHAGQPWRQQPLVVRL